MLAQGGDRQGYALYLSAGRLAFSVRVNRQVTTIVATDTPTGRLDVTARLDRDATMQLVINGRLAATGKAPGLIPIQPEDELSIGEDSRSAVVDDPPPQPFQGLISGVRITTD